MPVPYNGEIPVLSEPVFAEISVCVPCPALLGYEQIKRLMTDTTLTLEQALADFLQALAGKNRSAATSRAYQTDIHQFITWLHENNMVVLSPVQVERADITEYMATLATRRLSGVSRARKIAALR